VSTPGRSPSLPDFDPDCLFCRIAAGEEDAEIVLDEPGAVAFLDVRPLFHGHTLLIPRDHHVTLPDLPADEVGPLFQTAQRLATAITESMGAQGTFVAVNNIVSQSVPHLHVHIVPRTRKDGLKGFFWPRTKYETPGERADAGAKIRAALGAA
jgi:histidine triad (HIT) family protein